MSAHTPAIITDHPIEAAHISRRALEVVKTLEDAGHEAYLVGGCVRDLLLGLKPKDFDVSTSATPEEVRGLFRNARLIGRRFKLVHVRYGREIIEVATFRAGSEQLDEGNNVDDADVHEETGRILRDNVYGNMESDALRRDFTVNALYLRDADWAVIDYCDGVADLDARLLRIINDPKVRYREDPVRMLRAIRLGARLGFELETETAQQIPKLASLLDHIPPARLFDEYTKLFLLGSARVTWERLQDFGLTQHLFPQTSECVDQNHEQFERMVIKALENTDLRVAQDQRVTPAFLIAVFLWQPFLDALERQAESGQPPSLARQAAASEALARQAQQISIPKRFSSMVREIWDLQFRLDRRNGKRAARLFEHKRFRAAYDFLLLRERAGEELGGLGAWWTQYQEVGPEQRESMVRELGPMGRNPKRRPRRRRRPQTH